MFTGIVEETGRIINIARGANAIRLTLTACLTAHESKLGDSLAVNGCCLTVVEIGSVGQETFLAFDLLNETWSRTAFQDLQPDSLVNLERPLAVNGRIHGHFVTGHIDGIGYVRVFEQRGSDWFLEIGASDEILRYVLFKGSMAIDGISLTVADVAAAGFSVWIIPHTRQVTALKEKRSGDRVNLEVDMLAKYVEKFTQAHRS